MLSSHLVNVASPLLYFGQGLHCGFCPAANYPLVSIVTINVRIVTKNAENENRIIENIVYVWFCRKSNSSWQILKAACS